MKRKTIGTGSFEVNTSVLFIDDKVYIVDPGADAEDILAIASKPDFRIAGVMLTHAHFDHIGALPELEHKFPEIKVFVSKADAMIIEHPMNQYPPDYPAITAPKNIVDVSELANELQVEVIHTPGHTPGGVCYYFQAEKLLLAGDTLFAGSVGRTDLPGGDMSKLMDSLNKLKNLPRDTVVVPGHGMETTIGRELDMNPYLQR